MNQKELRRIWNIYEDVWKFHKKFSDPDGSDAFWQRLSAEGNALIHKYDSEFSRTIILAAVKEICQEEKRRLSRS